VSLLDYARDEYSQNGDDGIIERIFAVVSDGPGLCCEFGAWDGIRFSNTRALVLRGWHSVMIEADESKFTQLQRNYSGNDRVVCIQGEVDDGPSRLEKLLERVGISDRLDFLSIDIDGLDYYVFQSLTSRPRCIAVEVNAGHTPDREHLLPREIAARMVGQPLGAFVRVAAASGYRLIGYNGNAYFLHEDAESEIELPRIDPVDAYDDFLMRSSMDLRQWLYRVNLGLAPPYFRFGNPRLRRKPLHLSAVRAVTSALQGMFWRVAGRGRP
jgi:hypothetical protein